MDEGWVACDKRQPCKLCGDTHKWCCHGLRYNLCHRVESARPCPGSGCGWLHPIEAESGIAPAVLPPRAKRIPDAALDARFAPLAQAAHRAGQSRLPELARQLGVAVRALQALHVGWGEIDERWAWTFPERNAAGLVTGIALRLENPTRAGKTKLCAKGSRRGLCYAPGWMLGSGVVAIVEGGSDVAAAYTLGLSAIGRPSNTGGLPMIAAILKRYAPQRQVIVIGENDKKPPLYVSQLNPPHDPRCQACNRCHPGRFGAEETARRLEARIVYPPLPHKDLRAWLNAQGLALSDIAGCLERGATLRKGFFPRTIT